MEFAPDGRLFVAQQDGNLRVIQDGTLLDTPFLSLSVDSAGERGLLGVAFDPDFAANQYVYVYYTVPGSPAHNRVSRFTATGDVADTKSEFVLLDLDDLSDATNHNGGAIHFGLDGKLYIGVGENANPANAQTLTNLLGKMLRINADASIPEDNPFVSDPTARGEIWAYGFRNPFTFAVQPGTGRIFVNNVGSSPPAAQEEINDLLPGGNYGWPIYEGYSNDPAFISPLYAYPSGQGDGTCAIVGGTFYNPDTVQFPGDYVGTYFFSDLCAGWIRRFDPPYDPTTVSDFATDTPVTVVDLKVDSGGSLYYVTHGDPGGVYRIDYTGMAVQDRIGRPLADSLFTLTGQKQIKTGTPDRAVHKAAADMVFARPSFDRLFQDDVLWGVWLILSCMAGILPHQLTHRTFCPAERDHGERVKWQLPR
jgi:glucose/arabinose dehydrogenase